MGLKGKLMIVALTVVTGVVCFLQRDKILAMRK